jgi:hypothetical protein
MERKYAAAGAAVAVAVLLPLGRWVIASRQDAADERASRELERQFASRQAAATGAGQPSAGGGAWTWGRQGGPTGQGGQRRGNGQRGPDRSRRMEEMAREVGLNQTQVGQIQAVQQSSRPMMSDVFRNPQLTREQKMEAMQEIRAAQQTQISRFLSADQLARYTAYQQKMRERWQARRRENGGPGGGPAAGG